MRPDVDLDVEQLGGRLLRRVLVGDRPARCTRGGTEPPLQRDLVDFDYHTVDFVLDVVAVLAPVRDVLGYGVDALDPGGVVGHRQPPRRQRAVGVVQGLGAEPLGVAEAVADHPQLAARGDGRVLLPQRAGGAVAGIGERRLALCDQAGVEVLEVGDPEEHLAAHLEHVRHREFLGAGELFGDVVDGARIERDVLAGAAVAPGGAALQPAVAIHQRQRDAVDLEFAQVVRVVADLALDARRPRRELVRGEHVVQRQHPLEVFGGGEVGGEPGTADQLRRRIGGTQLRMSRPRAPAVRAAACRTPRRRRSGRPARNSGTDAHAPRRRVPASGDAGRRRVRPRPVRPARSSGLPSGSPWQASRARPTPEHASRYPGPMPHPIMFRDDDPGWRSAQDRPRLPRGVREGVARQAGVLRREDVRDVRRQRQDRRQGRVHLRTPTRSWSRSTRATAGPSNRTAASSSPPTWALGLARARPHRAQEGGLGRGHELIDASFRMIAPKKLIKQLDEA